jgi:hypothetical protein
MQWACERRHRFSWPEAAMDDPQKAITVNAAPSPGELA